MGIQTLGLFISLCEDSYAIFEHGSIRLPHVKLRLEKKGNEEATLSSAEQMIPTKITPVLNSVKDQLQLSISNRVGNVDGYDARQALKLQRILSEDFQVHIKDLQTGKEATLPFTSGHIPVPDASVADFVQKVSDIEDITGVLLTFPEDGAFSVNDEEAANELISIFNHGSFKQTDMTFSIQLRKPDIEYLLANLEHQKKISFRISFDESFVEILDKRIQLGPMVRFIRGKWDTSYHEVKNWYDKITENDSLEVKIEEAEVTEEFENLL